MKNLVALIAVCSIAVQLNAQKIIEKEITTSADRIEIEFKFADEITLTTWDKNTVYFKAEVSINNGEYDYYYELNIANSSSILRIESSYDDLFEFWKKERKSQNKIGNYCGPDIDINYTLYLPEKSNLKLKSISGNVVSDMYKGALEIDVISGDIDIHIDKSSLEAETMTGMIYADKDLEFDNEKNKIMGSRVTGSFGGVKNKLRLKTISGDIFIRKL